MMERKRLHNCPHCKCFVDRCENPECKKKFIVDDPRQRFCSRECADRVRWKRHAPVRVRDYKAEHEARKLKR